MNTYTEATRPLTLAAFRQRGVELRHMEVFTQEIAPGEPEVYWDIPYLLWLVSDGRPVYLEDFTLLMADYDYLAPGSGGAGGGFPVDHARAMAPGIALDRPLLLAPIREEEPERVALVDGHHRVYKAAQYGLHVLPFQVVTWAEATAARHTSMHDLAQRVVADLGGDPSLAWALLLREPGS